MSAPRKSGGEPQRPQPRHAPALEPPQAARLPPRLSQGPAVSSPPRESHALRAQPSARRPPAARGGSVITEPRGARRPPAGKHAAGPGTGKSGGEPQRPQPRHALALEPPQAARLPPRLSQGPAVSSPPRESHSVSFAGPALGTAPASGPWGFRHHGTSRRQTRTSEQARRRAGNGEERGRTPAPATPHAPALEPPASRGAYARLSQGPMVCYSRRGVPAGRGAHRTTRPAPTPGSPPIVCSGTTRTCENRGPPPLPFWEGRRRIGRGGETPPPPLFEKRYAACPGPRPGSRWPAGARPAQGSRTSAARLRTGGEEESPERGIPIQAVIV